MKRDMELIRNILFKIEEEFKPGSGWINEIDINGYDSQTIAEHCDLLYQDKLVRDYKAQYAGNQIFFFGVGPLTSQGFDFLDSIRNDEIWEKTKKKIEENNLPKTGKVIAEIAGTFIGSIIKSISE